MKKLQAWLLAFSLLTASGSLMAQKRKEGEVCLAGGVFFADGSYAPVGGICIGYTTKFIGAEVNGAALEGGGIFGGNLVVGLFDNPRLIPYVTGGAWTTTYGGFGFHAGGGIKIKLSQVYAFRIEYRRYFFDDSDWGVNAILGGISWFF